MIRLTLGAIFAVALVALAVHIAGSPWAFPLALGAAAVGCLIVATEGRMQ